MKMEIQKKIWTSRYEKRALTVAFVHTCALTACADPGFFVKRGGGGQARWPENSLDSVFFCFLVLNLFQWFYYRENYTFPRIQSGPTFSGGGGGGPASSGGWGGLNAYFYRPHITCAFPGGPDPYPPSGSAHEQRSSKN